MRVRSRCVLCVVRLCNQHFASAGHAYTHPFRRPIVLEGMYSSARVQQLHSHVVPPPFFPTGENGQPSSQPGACRHNQASPACNSRVQKNDAAVARVREWHTRVKVQRIMRASENTACISRHGEQHVQRMAYTCQGTEQCAGQRILRASRHREQCVRQGKGNNACVKAQRIMRDPRHRE